MNTKPQSLSPAKPEDGGVTRELRMLEAQQERAECALAALYSRLAGVLVQQNEACGSGCDEPGVVRCTLAESIATRAVQAGSLARRLEELAREIDL